VNIDAKPPEGTRSPSIGRLRTVPRFEVESLVDAAHGEVHVIWHGLEQGRVCLAMGILGGHDPGASLTTPALAVRPAASCPQGKTAGTTSREEWTQLERIHIERCISRLYAA
jgi:hypothetical protein